MKIVNPILVLFSSTVMLFASSSLETAQRLVQTKYTNWTYGPDAAKKQVDCTQFVEAVLIEMGVPLDATAKKAININYKFEGGVEAAARNGDQRTRGVHYALIDLLKAGQDVSPQTAQPGDFVQYWIFKSDGSVIGHSGIINRVIKGADGRPSAELYGAHATPPPKGTIGVAVTKPIWLTGTDRKVYIVRVNKT